MMPDDDDDDEGPQPEKCYATKETSLLSNDKYKSSDNKKESSCIHWGKREL